MARVIIHGGGEDVVVIFRDSRFQQAASGVARNKAEFDIPPGPYLVEASYPDGKTIRKTLDVGDRGAELLLSSTRPSTRVAKPRTDRKGPLMRIPRAAPQPVRPRLSHSKGISAERLVFGETPLAQRHGNVGGYLRELSDAAFSGKVDVLAPALEGRIVFNEGQVSQLDFGKDAPSASFDEIVERLSFSQVGLSELRVERKGCHLASWTWTDGHWSESELSRAGGSVVTQQPQLGLLQVLTPERSEFVAFSSELPEARIVIDNKGRATLNFRRDAQALLEFVYQGQHHAAKVLARSLVEGKYENPPLAAVGGYFLLDHPDTIPVPDFWWTNLANIDWLPDGAIIAGWRALRADRLADARRLFLEASSRGIPLFTRGLRFLLDGLWAFGDDPQTSNAANRLRRYGDSARHAAAVTTFAGATPERPTRSEAPAIPPATAVAFPRARLKEGMTVG